MFVNLFFNQSIIRDKYIIWKVCLYNQLHDDVLELVYM